MNTERLDRRDAARAHDALEALCLRCARCSDSCYVAVAKRAIATISQKAPAAAAG